MGGTKYILPFAYRMESSLRTGKPWRLLYIATVVISAAILLVACTPPPPNLPAYPPGLRPGTEGWIPPLPPGMLQPRTLSAEEWDKVTEIARTDPQAVKQIEKDNIYNAEHYWVGYAGGPGSNSFADSEFMAGKIGPPGYHWYYPAIMFNYRSRVYLSQRDNRDAQLVGVDLNTSKIVYYAGRGGVIPPRIPPGG